jgi:hypothetical protein
MISASASPGSGDARRRAGWVKLRRLDVRIISVETRSMSVSSSTRRRMALAVPCLVLAAAVQPARGSTAGRHDDGATAPPLP